MTSSRPWDCRVAAHCIRIGTSCLSRGYQVILQLQRSNRGALSSNRTPRCFRGIEVRLVEAYAATFRSFLSHERKKTGNTSYFVHALESVWVASAAVGSPPTLLLCTRFKTKPQGTLHAAAAFLLPMGVVIIRMPRKSLTLITRRSSTVSLNLQPFRPTVWTRTHPPSPTLSECGVVSFAALKLEGNAINRKPEYVQQLREIPHTYFRIAPLLLPKLCSQREEALSKINTLPASLRALTQDTWAQPGKVRVQFEKIAARNQFRRRTSEF